MLLRFQKPRNGIRLPDVKGPVAVRIIGGNKVIFSAPSPDTGVCPVIGNGECIMLLMYLPGEGIGSFREKSTSDRFQSMRFQALLPSL